MEVKEPRIRLELKYGQPEVSLDACLPISAVEVSDHAERGWTVNELAQIAFRNIPEEFVAARIHIGGTLESLGEDGAPSSLPAYGPEEGDYYIDFSSQKRERMEQ